MKRVLLVSAVAILVSIGGATSFAAPQTIRSDELRASKVIGSAVYDRNNQKVGSVQDIILGPGGKVDNVIVSTGSTMGVGGKDIAIPMADLKTDHDRLTLNKTQEQLSQAPAYDLTNNNTGAGETASSPRGGNAANPH